MTYTLQKEKLLHPLPNQVHEAQQTPALEHLKGTNRSAACVVVDELLDALILMNCTLFCCAGTVGCWCRTSTGVRSPSGAWLAAAGHLLVISQMQPAAEHVAREL